MDNLEEMDKFLESYSLPRLNDKEIENLNRLITSTRTETVIKKLPHKTKVQDQMASQVNSTKCLEKSSHLSFSNYLKKLKRKECFLTH